MPKDGDFNVLLIKRAQEPYRGLYALPGGFLDIQETLEEAALRELEEETGLKTPHLAQVHTFSTLGRDPRDRVISTCFAAILPDTSLIDLKAGSDAADLLWLNINELPPLAFDHNLVIQLVIEKFLYPQQDW